MPEYNFIESTGVILVDTSTTLAEVQQEYKDAFNDQDLVVDSGDLSVLINAEAQQRDEIANNNAELANQINPNEAGGVFLDALYALFNSERDAGERTTVTATLGGVAGTLIAEGSAAQSVEGDRFTSTSDATIGVGGTITVTFQSDDIGPVPMGANELTKVLDSVLGWETIDNASAGNIGELVESDADAANSRNALLGAQSNSMSESTIAAVTDVADVQSVSYRENVSSSPQTIDGVNMLANSIFVCVDGGTDSDIYQALLTSKSGGCDWTGDEESTTVTDPISGQDYTVRFQRPDEIALDIQVTITPDSTLTDPIQLAKDAVLAYANGEIDEFNGFIVGADVEPFIINNAVNTYDASLNASRVEVRLNGVPPFSTDDIAIQVFEKATITEGDISVTVL